MALYRRTRLKVREQLVQVKQAGFDSVRVEGEGDIADICRLTCLEQGIRPIMTGVPADSTGSAAAARTLKAASEGGSLPDGEIPVLEVRGTKVFLRI
jgi:hypothetical protein